MNIIQAIFLGIIQGITEVLPISSSGHLVLIPWIFNFKDPGLSFDVALHLGTLLAIVGFFYRDILNILKGGFDLVTKKDPSDFYQKMFLFLAVATVPGVLAGIFLEKYASDAFRSPILIASMLVLFGLVLFVADRLDVKPKTLQRISFIDALTIGISQAVAIIPGVSRSGITISAGLFIKLTREDAARFSFLLSVPIILGAAVYELKDLSYESLFSSIFIAGFVAAAISSFLSVKFLLSFVRNHNFNVFVYYRIVLAAVIVVISLLK